MFLFKSRREKRLWLWTIAALVGIYATIPFARTMAGILRDRGMLTAGFWLCIILVWATVLAHGLRIRPGKAEIAVWLGIAAIYLLVFLRMNIPEERSHLIEYSVVAIFIHEALRERKIHGGRIRVPAFLAILATALLGVIDECIQALLPNRVFDPLDMLFNTLAGFMAVGSSLVLNWVRRKITKLK